MSGEGRRRTRSEDEFEEWFLSLPMFKSTKHALGWGAAFAAALFTATFAYTSSHEQHKTHIEQSR